MNETDIKPCPFALEILRREWLNIRAAIRQAKLMEPQICQAIPTDEQVAQVAELDRAITLLSACESIAKNGGGE